jgi:kynurenine formamidase
LTGVGALPATGAFYCMLSPKYAGGPYSEARAYAIVGDPLARRLTDSARKKNAVDLSVVVGEDLPVSWPGRGSGNHRQPYLRIRLGYNANTHADIEAHMLGSDTGTHLVPPAYALPSENTSSHSDVPEVRQWLTEYEKSYGPCGTSDVTTEKVPLSQSCGRARVIDVQHRLGTTDRSAWPASPEITVSDIERYEQKHGALRAGNIVLFHSGWSDRYFRPLPGGKACLDDPLNGKSEGWPAPGPAAIVYLSKKGIRCVGTDGPTLGGVDPKRALMTYWALGSKGMIGIEYLTNLARVPEEGYFLFAAIKLQGCHGGPGRAIALF